MKFGFYKIFSPYFLSRKIKGTALRKTKDLIKSNRFLRKISNNEIISHSDDFN